MAKLYTIGCSNQELPELIKILKKNKIDSIADVRSVPYSKYTPQFNAENISIELKKHHIYYLPFSKEFGARRSEQEAYSKGKVDFEKVMKLESFKAGVERIKDGLSKNHNIALMCTEKDPIDCHRFSLVARGINRIANINSLHIHTSGKIETTESVEQRMIEKYKIQPNIFCSNPNELINEAYFKVNQAVAYAEIQKEENYD